MKIIYKIPFVFAWVLFCLNGTIAQTDTTIVTEEYMEEEVDYLTPMEYAFMMHEETKWMFKLSFPVSPNEDPNLTFLAIPPQLRTSSALSIGYERKISDPFSIDMGFALTSFSGGDPHFEVTLAPRYYYNMKKRMKQNKFASNLSGNYVSVGTKYLFNDIYGNILGLFTRWGMQRRYLKRGFIDFGIEGAYSLLIDSPLGDVITIGTKVNLGLAWAKDKKEFDDSKLCDIVKCYESQSGLLKLNITNLMNTAFAGNKYSLNFNADISYEKKIGDSPFSLNTQLVGTLNFLGSGSFFRSNRYEIVGRIGPRYYHNLKNRIAKGKAGNGLSANYLSVDMVYFAFANRGRNNNEPTKVNDQRFATDLLYGIQRTISDNFYYDIRFGVGVNYGSNQYLELTRIRTPFIIGVGFRL